MIPEILAPAGSMEALKAAVHAGADAVYLGGSRFGARAFADNFDENTLIQGIEYCHIYGVKVYLTVNTLFRNEEMEELYDYLAPYYEAGLDAVIVQDLGVVLYIHEHFPGLSIHASTQMTITTEYAYSLLMDYGVTRIVPARELSMEEIRQLKAAECVPEVEIFVQGALCYCYSGQCLMSSMLGGRSGNRGRCAQTCRLPYSVLDKEGQMVRTEGPYVLSPKDLCGLEAVPELIRAGVDSFKIEGRMKKPEYVAACVKAYRCIVDAWFQGSYSDELIEHCKNEMAEVFNRGGFTRGYFSQKNGKNMMSFKAPGNIGVVIGYIEDIRKNKLIIRLSKNVSKGDILMLNGEKNQITLTCNVEGNKQQQIILNAPKSKELLNGQSVYRMLHAPLMEELGQYTSTEKPIALQGTMEMMQGKPACFTISMDNGKKSYQVTVYGDIVEEASKNPVTREMIMDKVGKTGNTRYYFEKLDMNIAENVFYSLKALKQLRRKAIGQLESVVLNQYRRSRDEIKADQSVVTKGTVKHKWDNGYCTAVSFMVSDEKQFHILNEDKRIKDIYLDLQYFKKEDIIELINEYDRGKHIFLVLPPVLRHGFIKEMKDVLQCIPEQITGLIVRNLDELAYLKNANYSGEVITDYSLYVMNAYAVRFVRNNFPEARITIPVELNEKQIETLPFLHDNCEMEVYGYQQLMVSAQCIQNNMRQCNQDNPVFWLKDRYNKMFYVKSVCKYCYSLYYNGIPTILFDLVKKNPNMNITLRLHFTRENEQEVRNILDAFFNNHSFDGEKTRGHYNRGVE